MSRLLSRGHLQDFASVVKSFSLVEQKILTGRDIMAGVTYDRIWAICYCPELRLGLRGQHDALLMEVAEESGYSFEDVISIERKVLLKIKHPSRLRKFKEILADG